MPTKACPFLLRHPPLPRRPFKFGPLSIVPVAGRPRAGLQGPGGTGLALWGWSAGRFCGFFPEFWSSREGVRKPLWGQGWGSPKEVRGRRQEVEDKKVFGGRSGERHLGGSE